ncbi:hypothetical protein ACFFGV_04370 [Pontibacillus salicampi]|uniref:Uncharacterized protein n=1 Tax=Pontibacillus salicampi TaxID=1449801 RepID=A0ABV6LKJ2_9BACI
MDEPRPHRKMVEFTPSFFEEAWPFISRKASVFQAIPFPEKRIGPITERLRVDRSWSNLILSIIYKKCKISLIFVGISLLTGFSFIISSK